MFFNLILFLIYFECYDWFRGLHVVDFPSSFTATADATRLSLVLVTLYVACANKSKIELLSNSYFRVLLLLTRMCPASKFFHKKYTSPSAMPLYCKETFWLQQNCEQMVRCERVSCVSEYNPKLSSTVPRSSTV